MVEIQRLANMQHDAQRNHQLAYSIACPGSSFQLRELLVVGRRRSTAVSAFLRQESLSKVRQLQQFVRLHVDRMQFGVRALMSWPVQWAGKWLLIPDASMKLVELVSCAKQTAQNIVSWTIFEKGPKDEQGTRRQAAAWLDAHWARQHEVYEHDRAEPIPPVPTAAGSVCWEAGYCVCSAHGKQIKSLRAKLLRSLSRMFPASKPWLQQHLVGRDIFLMMVGAPAGDVTDPGPDDKFFMAEGEKYVVWHVATLYKSPFGPTLQVMKVIEENGHGPVDDFVGGCALC